MKIVKRPEFLKLPPGTVYAKYEPCIFGELQIKGDTLPNGNDWFYQDIADAVKTEGDRTQEIFNAEDTGISIEMDFNCQGRDGAFEPDDQMFAVWERADVEALIERLKETLG